MYNYNVHIVQHQKNQMIGLANGSSGGGGNVSGGEESEPEVSRVTDGTRLNLDVDCSRGRNNFFVWQMKTKQQILSLD